MRRYNADLANDFGNLAEPDRVDDQSLSRGRASGAARGRRLGRSPRAGRRRSERYRAASRAACLHEALAELWEFVGAANKAVDAEQPWVLAKAAKAGDDDGGGAARGVLGDLLEACRLVGLAVAPFMPGDRAARAGPARARVRRTGRTATAGRRSSTSCAGAPTPAKPGRVATPEPLFPRLDTEAVTAESATPA